MTTSSKLTVSPPSVPFPSPSVQRGWVGRENKAYVEGLYAVQSAVWSEEMSRCTEMKAALMWAGTYMKLNSVKLQAQVGERRPRQYSLAHFPELAISPLQIEFEQAAVRWEFNLYMTGMFVPNVLQ